MSDAGAFGFSERVGVIVSNEDGRILSINPAAVAILGIESAVPGDHALTVLPDPAMAELIRAGGRGWFEIEKRTVLIDAPPGGGAVLVLEITDFTRTMSWDFEVLDAIASGVGGPLSVLTALTSSGDDSWGDEDRVLLGQAALEAGALIQDLLVVLGSRLRAVESSKDRIEVEPFLETLRRTLSPALPLRVESPSHLFVQADRALLAAGLRGLVMELASFGREEILLRAYRRENYAAFEAGVRLEPGQAPPSRPGAGVVLARCVAEALRVPLWIRAEHGAYTLSLRHPLP